MTDTHETELEFAGELRPCTVSYVNDVDEIVIQRVVMRRDVVAHYSSDGLYMPRVLSHTANVTALLSPAQIKGLVMEITEALTDPEWDDAALLPLCRVTGMEEPA